MSISYKPTSIKALNEKKTAAAEQAREISGKIELLTEGQSYAQGQVLDAYEALAAVFEDNLVLREEVAEGQAQAQSQMLDAFEALAVVFEDNLALSDAVAEGQAQAQGQVLDAYEALAAVFEDNLALRAEFATLGDAYTELRYEFAALKERADAPTDASVENAGDPESQ